MPIYLDPARFALEAVIREQRFDLLPTEDLNPHLTSLFLDPAEDWVCEAIGETLFQPETARAKRRVAHACWTKALSLAEYHRHYLQGSTDTEDRPAEGTSPQHTLASAQALEREASRLVAEIAGILPAAPESAEYDSLAEEEEATA